MNSRKIILAKNPILANSRNSRKFLPKISRIFPLAKVSSAKVSSFKNESDDEWEEMDASESSNETTRNCVNRLYQPNF